MEMIPRDDYLNWIDEFRDKPLVKVLTGLRRSGKSTILDLFMARLENEGVAASRIIKINFELLENEPYLDYRKLYSHIVDSRAEGCCTYVFLDEIQHVKNYEKTVDSLLARGGFDIYITGSTSELLSSELGMHITQPIAICSSGKHRIRHNPLCSVESTAYPVLLNWRHC